MTKSSHRETIFCVFLLGIVLCVITLFPSLISSPEALLRRLTLFLPFSLYLLNRGQDMTKAMYMNCDHAMLHYSFYREPQTLLALFRRRLISLVRVNLEPAFVIAAAFLLIPLLSGQAPGPTEFLSILAAFAMALFFSVHTLVLYYLLQPFDLKNEIKNPVYKAISLITYIVCFEINNVVKEANLSSDTFCIGMIGFTVLYVVIGMVLVYRLAPKTFRVKK